jgi:hypothetical protein
MFLKLKELKMLQAKSLKFRRYLYLLIYIYIISINKLGSPYACQLNLYYSASNIVISIVLCDVYDGINKLINCLLL